MNHKTSFVTLFCATLISCALVSCTDPAPPATPVAQTPPRPATGCGAIANLISEVQGKGAASPMLGKLVTVEAIVTYTPLELGGMFVQEERDDRDGSPETSEGLFLALDAAKNAKAGDIVRATGTVSEMGDAGKSLTSLVDLSEFRVCGSGKIPAETSLEQAPLVAADWERFEAMRVHLDLPVTVLQNENVLRTGEVMVGLAGRQFVPTQRFAPGEDARKLGLENQRNRLLLDDGSLLEWPAKIVWLSQNVSAAAPFRLGTRLGEVKGVLDQRGGFYRLQLMEAPVMEQATRSNKLDAPSAEDNAVPELRVASFNVENLFNGDGKGGGFPTARGAKTAEEAQRQRIKLINVIKAIKPDIAALMEVENDDDSKQSALAEFVRALNQQTGLGYVAVTTPATSNGKLGSDEIRVALIYRGASVRLRGKSATITTAPFDQLNRPPLLQSFIDIKSGGVFSVVANHWKSKGGCDPKNLENADTDGQGCWNATRVAAANALLAWLKTDPTAAADTDVLVLGDLNAYGKEDPLRALHAGGYMHLAEGTPEQPNYSFSFAGELGSLDHGLASESLKNQVSSAQIWHINADEYPGFGYSMQTPAHQALYAKTPYRCSDHDPLIVGLRLTK
jgi:uncharacterized protein